MGLFGFFHAIILAILTALLSSLSYSEPAQPPAVDSFTLDLSGSERPEVLSVSVSGADNAYISNLYNVHYLHTDVVGLFGCPVEVTADEFDGAKLIFEYNSADMNLVPPENLLILWYDETNDYYLEINGEINTDTCTVTYPLKTGGAYMLVDKYEWYTAWGWDAEEYAHDTLFVGGAYAPEFNIVIPREFELSQYADDYGTNDNGISYNRLCGTAMGDERYFTAYYYSGVDAWQKNCDGNAEVMMIYADDDSFSYEPLNYTADLGVQSQLYMFSYDETSRGRGSGKSFLLQIKISNDDYLSFSIGGELDDTELEGLAMECFNSFKWVDTPSEEAFEPAAAWDASQHPELSVKPAEVQLVDCVYDVDTPAFTMQLPDCLTQNPRKGSMEFEDENGFTWRSLMFCNGSDDIYADIKYCNGENIWQNKELTESFIFAVEGESHTIEDISAETGCEAQIYTLRFADTGKVESNHLTIYVFGFYKLSDNEVVVICYDLWADAEEEYMELIKQSLKSFRFSGR